jgi:hypothetical protein
MVKWLAGKRVELAGREAESRQGKGTELKKYISSDADSSDDQKIIHCGRRSDGGWNCKPHK